MTQPAAAGLCNSSQQEYPPDEWRIAGELIRQIGTATTWQRVVEAGDALMTVSRMARSMRDERDHHAQAEGRRQVDNHVCLGGHRWTGTHDSCCPQCNRRASASGIFAVQPKAE